jgi:orotate phosphoribosyltransferase
VPETPAQIADGILDRTGAHLAGEHFVYISGQHGSGWIDKDRVYPHTQLTATLGRLVAEAVRGRGIEVVCGPATGGLILAQWTAHALGALAVFGEHAGAGAGGDARPFVVTRGYEHLIDGRRVLVVDDVVNTGFSIKGTIEAVRAHGGEVREAAAIVNRGALEAAAIGVDELIAITDIRLESWPREACPLCAQGVPVNTRYAHGADFVVAGGNWP